MTVIRSPKSFLAIGVLALGLAACGSDETPAGEQLPEPGPEVTETPDDADSQAADDDDSEGAVLGAAEMNGDIVDPKPHTIDSVDIQESFPEQLVVNFTGGDPNCTAAAAQAISVDGQIVVSLEVGITEDALTRSCLDGEFDHALAIPLSEGLAGRPVTTTL